MTATRSVSIAVLFGLLGFGVAHGVERIAVRIDDLPAVGRTLLGRQIATHGCFVHTPHGDDIEPCGNTQWQKITAVVDPTGIASKNFRRLRASFADSIEADFSGTLVEIEVRSPTPHRHIVLQMQTMEKARVSRDSKQGK